MLKYLVVDSGAIIRGENLANKAENYVTVRGVIEEIRDKKSRKFLDSLPYELEIKSPSIEALRDVVEIAKESGDYRVLSKIDIQVLALTYMLSNKDSQNDLTRLPKANIGVKKVFEIKKTSQASPATSPWNSLFPNSNQTVSTSKSDKWDDSDFVETKTEEKETTDNEKEWPTLAGKASLAISEVDESQLKSIQARFDNLHLKKKKSKNVNNEPVFVEDSLPKPSAASAPTVSRIINPAISNEVAAVASNFDGEWINELNFQSHLQLGQTSKCVTEKKDIETACVTVDYAMQSVLLRMKLNLFGLEGRQISELKQYLLKCDTCSFETKELEKLFCPQCGKPTLKRLFYTVTENGDISYHFKKNRVITTKGTKYSIPSKHSKRARKTNKTGAKKGKFHRHRLLLREDQLFSGYWREKMNKKSKIKSLFDDKVYEDMNKSKSIKIGEEVVVGYGRKNPNSKKGRERRGKKKYIL